MNILAILLFVLACFSMVYLSRDFKIKMNRIKVVAVNRENLEANESMTRIDRYTVAQNLFIQLKRDIPPHYKIILQCYEFLNNEYRRFAIRLEKYFCNYLEVEYKAMMYPDFVRIGANMPKPKCPVLKGNYSFYNYTATSAFFPPELPFKNVLIEVKLLDGKTLDFHAHFYFSLDRDVVIREQYS